MFSRPIAQESKTTDQISVATPTLPGRRARVQRYIKRSIALMLVAAAVTAFIANAGYVSSDRAVVTAHLVSLRSPIEGVVQARAGSVGEPVAPGTMLAQIVNPLADDRSIADLRLQATREYAQLTSMRQQVAALQALRNDFRERAERYRQAEMEQLALAADGVEQDRAAKIETLQQLVRDMDRKLLLRDAVPRVEVELATSAVRVATEQLAALDRQVAAAHAATRDAAEGMIVQANSANDVAYSGQRADEIKVRLVELERSIGETEAALAETKGRLETESAMMQRLSRATVTAPASGMIWRLGAGPGERVAPGDLLGQIVDCGAAFLAVDVPQDRLSEIDIGAPASFRLSGETRDRIGRITAVIGEAAVHQDETLAMVPAPSTRAVASVIVAVPPSPNKAGLCLVGRTVRVLLPAVHVGWLEWVRRQLPL